MRLKPADRVIARRIASAVDPTVATSPYPSPYRNLPDARGTLKPAMQHISLVAKVTREAMETLEHGFKLRDTARREWDASDLRSSYGMLNHAVLHLRRNGLTELADELEHTVKQVIAEDAKILGEGRVVVGG